MPMKHRGIRIVIGILLAVTSMYFIMLWLYKDIFLDMGGAVIDGTCYDENYHEVHLIVDSVVPLTLLALVYISAVTLCVNFVLSKVFRNVHK